MDTRRSRPARRLFWKLLLVLCVSNVASLVATAVYFRFEESRHQDHEFPVILGFIPVPPAVSGGIAILLTGLALAWYLSHPLNHLSWALRQAAGGRLDTRVGPLMGGRRDEIADLAEDFDRMASRLQKLTESRKQLLHDISHELRSPLSRMQAAIGLLHQAPEQLEAMLGRIERETGRLDELIEELLTLHRLEADALPAGEHSRVDLVEILQDIVEDAHFEATPSARAVRCHGDGRFVADVNGELIYRAFENVVRNAVKFTAPGTTVEVDTALEDGGRTLLVRVQDRGPGVPADQLEAIFEPFVRVEGSEHARGVGLGLAIARRAVLLHGGRIEARARDGGGLVMEVRLPQSFAGARAQPPSRSGLAAHPGDAPE